MAGAELSIVIPTRNRRALLARLLRNLSDVESLRFEIIVIDEASSDDTAAMLVDEFSDMDIRVHRHEVPAGVPTARNVGVSLATAPLVAWIDDDDLSAPSRFTQQMAVMRAEKRAWSIAGRVDIDDYYNIIGFRRCPPVDDLMVRLRRSNVLPSVGQGIVMERSLFNDVGGFDPALTVVEDWDFGIRVLECAQPVMVDEPLVGYRLAASSLSRDTQMMERSIGALAAKHDADIDWATVHRSLLLSDLRASRIRALRRCVRLARSGSPADALLFSPFAAISPRAGAKLLLARRRSTIPQEWAGRARPWLDRVRSVERRARLSSPFSPSFSTDLETTRAVIG
jgi:glycosyltransferase involved in cell wall biosynthesis